MFPGGGASSLELRTVRALTAVPVYAAKIVSKSLPLVSNVAWPVPVAVQSNQTDLAPNIGVPSIATVGFVGSPGSLVAKALLPLTVPELPPMTCALAKLLLGGAVVALVVKPKASIAPRSLSVIV